MTKDKMLSHKEMFEFLTDSYYSEEEVSLKLKKEIENTLFEESPEYSFLYINFLFKHTYNIFVSYNKPVESISFNPELSYDYLNLLLENKIYLTNDSLKQLMNCIDGPFSFNRDKISDLLITMLDNMDKSNNFLRCFRFIYKYVNSRNENWIIFRYILINKILINKEILDILELDLSYRNNVFSSYVKDLTTEYGPIDKYVKFFNSLKNQK